MVDTLVLGTSAQAWEFESLHAHYFTRYVYVYLVKGDYMKIYPISQSIQQQTCYRGHFPIDGGGGARLVPEWYLPKAAKKTAEGASLFGWIAAGFAALVGLGSLLAHKIDKDLVNKGELDTSDMYNPDMDRMYM